MAKQKSRSDRWSEAIAAARTAHSDAETAAAVLHEKLESLQAAIEALHDVQQEYEEWHGNLPENLASSALGDKLETVTNIAIDDFTNLDDPAADMLDEISGMLDECENADLPRGFGRD